MSADADKPLASYVYGLDMARFLCALMVAMFHLTWRVPETAMYVPFGWVGVQVFFVISGVVIASSAALSTPSQFVKGRFLRLYPAAWIAAIVNLGFLLSLPFEAYRTMGISVACSSDAVFSSLILVGESFLASAYWTLPIELAFYALVFACLLKGGAERFRTIARALIAVSIPYLVLLFVAYTGQASLKWIDLGYGARNMLLVRHGPFFAIGLYFWLIVMRRKLEPVDYGLLAAGVAAGGLEIYARAAQVIPYYAIGAGKFSVIVLATGALVVFALFSGFVFLSLRNAASWVPSARMRASLRMAGLITYPYYLIHELMGGFVLHQALDAGLGRHASLAIALSTVGVAACLIACHAEPMLRHAIAKAVGWAEVLAREFRKA